VVGDTEFPVADIDTNKLPDEFAAHQIKTTANFATRNKVISWLVGGLNFQIEHHLFPKISHVHYPAISEIVRSVCSEYQLQYIEYPTMRKAVVEHVRFLRREIRLRSDLRGLERIFNQNIKQKVIPHHTGFDFFF
jgi:linoleoyl-CoA desaturase